MLDNEIKAELRKVVREAVQSVAKDEDPMGPWHIVAVLVFLIPWLMGFAMVSGFWQTLYCFFPPYAWYLVVEYFMQLGGMI